MNHEVHYIFSFAAHDYLRFEECTRGRDSEQTVRNIQGGCWEATKRHRAASATNQEEKEEEKEEKKEEEKEEKE